MKTIVIVLYNQELTACKTFQTLNETLLKKEEDIIKKFEIIIYDNSPVKAAFDKGDFPNVNISYIHDARNNGLISAYNFAWKTAIENGSEWLLLLDHDTELTYEYVDYVTVFQEDNRSISAIVPQIFSNDTLISPVSALALRPLKEERPTKGIVSKPIMAINSGTLVRVSFLNELNGFNIQFPLDYLDHWLFYEIFERGYSVLVLPLKLQHDLSVLNYSNVSLKRYQSILDSEILFYSLYKKDLMKAYKKQLLKRIGKQLLTVKNKKIVLYTIRKFYSL